MAEPDNVSATQHDINEQIVYRQMENDTDGCGYGIVFTLAGMLFCGVAIVLICHGNYSCWLMGFVGMLLICFGAPLICSYIAQVKISNEEVCLTLWPFTLQRIATADICTLAYTTMTPNIRGNPWTAEIILLSPRPSTQIRYFARRWVKDEELAAITDPAEKERAIMRKSAESYFRSNISGFHLKCSEGIWMEYTPARAKIVKALFPNATDFIPKQEDNL